MSSSAGLSRRGFLAGAGAAVGAMSLPPFARSALGAPPRCAGLNDIEHVVIFIQENRSFDHYFGSYRGVRGFADRNVPDGVFNQAWAADKDKSPVGRLLPFHLDSATSNAQCVNDITHEWGPQHESWNGGKMDGFVKAHVAADGPTQGTATMGYYTRADLDYYYALADNFTLCDGYHHSIFGPTYPNRLYSMTATIDPGGKAGGPVVTNPGAGPGDFTGLYSWTTYPERLQAAGISWKVYSQLGTNNNVLGLFSQYRTDPNLERNALLPVFPTDFEIDCATGNLPQVSWVLTPMSNDEHPPSPPRRGEFWTSVVLNTLMSNASIWSKTVMFLTYDENGGFFDHVAPPVAPEGTAGEYLTISSLPPEAAGIRGPIGLAFRVPLLVLSPFSRGGMVCSDTFDHTSTLRFLETRFGVEVPNLSAWRRSVTGDLTSTLQLGNPNTDTPSLPVPPPADLNYVQECAVPEAQSNFGNAPDYALPATQSMPSQEPGAARRLSVVCGVSTAVTPPVSAGPASLPNTGVSTRAELFAAVTAVAAGALASGLYRSRRRASSPAEPAPASDAAATAEPPPSRP